jgi:hypothetical protein
MNTTTEKDGFRFHDPTERRGEVRAVLGETSNIQHRTPNIESSGRTPIGREDSLLMQPGGRPKGGGEIACKWLTRISLP